MPDNILRTRIETIGHRISVARLRLLSCGFCFDRPEEVMPGPDPNAQSVINQIESVAGTLPQALKLFWLRVGSVDFSGRHPEWHGCEYLDQLMVFSADLALEELNECVLDREERTRANVSFSVPISPDIFHKANVSGGPPYALAVPAITEDPPLLHAVPTVSFLAHIERALRYGGFPGLAECPEHTWPLSDLVRDDG
jgi:hypothetical protein